MHILVLNPGSSSIKFSLYAATEASPAQSEGEFRSLYDGELGGIGGRSPKLTFHDAAGNDLSDGLGSVAIGSMEEAIAVVERAVSLANLPSIDAVGYRVVHPGAHLRGHQRLTPQVLAKLHEAIPFAPLHDPEALQMIDQTMRHFPSIPHIACFDTVFHETMPEEATVYALPYAVRQQGVRRYGFHGLSCESVVAQLHEAVGVEFPRSMLIAHLGSGCSVTAVVDGKSVETTMGLTPTGGVMMGTRTGDLDPGVVLFLMRQAGATADSVERMLDGDAGLKALGGVNDMRELRKRADAGDARTQLALTVFTRTLAKTAAGLTALHHPTAVVFTGGIGEHDPLTRSAIALGLEAFGAELEPAANDLPANALPATALSKASTALRKISTEESRLVLYVVPAEEDRMIARHVARISHAPSTSAAVST